jgi:hypothetical protein
MAPSPALVFDTLVAYQRSAALRAAIELDLFRAIGEGPGDVASLAGRCSASERGIRILCDYLVVIELLARRTAVPHTPTSRVFLDPSSPALWHRLLFSKPTMCGLTRLADIVRNGRTIPETVRSTENPVWVEFAHSMAPMLAPALLGEIALDGLSGRCASRHRRGHGLFGIEWQATPEAQIVALD